MNLLQVKKLCVRYNQVVACQDVDITIAEKQIVGLIGQSGSGKSSVAKAILQLGAEAQIEFNKLCFSGVDFDQLNAKRRLQLREQIAWIPQDPTTAFCEHLKMQTQLTEQMRFVQKMSKKEAINKAVEMMELVGISEPLMRLKQYPYQLSGGIRQRMLIAMALCQNPRLIIADELTASLDTLNKANLAKLILEIQHKLGLSFLIISHDLNFVQSICSMIYVMFASQIVEKRETKQFFQDPQHPYSRALIEATSTLTKAGKNVPIQLPASAGELTSSTSQLKEVGANAQQLRSQRPSGPLCSI